jgi:hypothetical protein
MTRSSHVLHAKEAALERMIRLSFYVKRDVRLSYHLCYGDIQTPALCRTPRYVPVGRVWE